MAGVENRAGPVLCGGVGCQFDGVMPWDRFCASCGRDLLVDPADRKAPLWEAPQVVRIEAGSGQAITEVPFVFKNRSNVVVHVRVVELHIAGAARPPDWFKGVNGTNGFRLLDERVEPGQHLAMVAQIDSGVIERLKTAPDIAERAVAYELPVYVDADYGNQKSFIQFSLLGQADLRPVALEWPLVWLNHEGCIDLPLSVKNASGEDMVITDVRLVADPGSGDAKAIVDALFPNDVFNTFAGKRLPPGSVLELAMQSRPVGPTLRRLVEAGAKFVGDDFPKRFLSERTRSAQWIQQFGPIIRVRFLVEATLRAPNGGRVPPVRSLCVLTLVRPPLLRDATPSDPLWRGESGPADKEGKILRCKGDGKPEYFIAGLVNDSAVPVRIQALTCDKRWVQIPPDCVGKALKPGAEFELKVMVDLSQRTDDDHAEDGNLRAAFEVVTSPPTPLQCIDPLYLQADATTIIPGWLGIDFGTSNCAVCYLPWGEDPDPSNPNPISLILDRVAPLPLQPNAGTLLDGMPSLLCRRWDSGDALASSVNPDFLLGAAALALSGDVRVPPINVVRDVKRRVLAAKSTWDAHKFRLHPDEGTEPFVDVPVVELARTAIMHLMRQVEYMAAETKGFHERLNYAVLNPDLGNEGGWMVPSAQQMNKARAFKFRQAVFTHPVDATPTFKELLYECAQKAGLARTIDGRDLTFAEFCEERLIDESTAAVTSFVSLPSVRARLVQPKRVYRIVCIDIGGGTTDISAIELDACTRDWSLSVAFRKGINDFAGADLDLAIAEHVILPAAEARLREIGGNLLLEYVAQVLREVGQHRVVEKFRERFPEFWAEAEGWGQPGTALETPEDRVWSGLYSLAQQSRFLAEELKKQAGVEGVANWVGKINTSRLLYVVEGRVSPLGQTIPELTVTCETMSVNDLISRLVAAQMPKVDAVVDAAGWGWAKVDFLMLTGQTCRAPAVRDTILGHVANRRGSLPTLVIPPHGSSAIYSDPNTILFDPKACVPAGAALVGKSPHRRVKSKERVRATASVYCEDRLPVFLKVTQGVPLPCTAACETQLEQDTNCRSVRIIIGNQRNSPVIDVMDIPSGVETDDGKVALMVDESLSVWLVAGAEEGAAVDSVPEAVVRTAQAIPRGELPSFGLRGPSIVWFRKVGDLPAAKSGAT